MGGGGALRPDGPVVWLTLPDGQVVSAVVRARRREPRADYDPEPDGDPLVWHYRGPVVV
ncbi:hypothetical protein STBA_02540 [Streptomyces sp. MP131-18]|nr:hypothetical protein STBA_02540 [Streptomyces sp. MP131-18]